MLPKEKTKREPNYLKKTMLVYAPPKTGKSTLASKLGDDKNKILFFATEQGYKELEIYKWCKENGDDPTTWDDFRACVKEFTEQKEFQCLAIDTIDNLFHWCSKYVNKKHNISHESDLGFGKGYAFIKDELLTIFNYLTQKGYGVIFISHSATKDKELGNRKITYTDSTLPSTAQKVIHGLCDYIFYAYVDLDGKRWIRTKGTETVNAGDRSGRIPEILPLDADILKKELLKTGDEPTTKEIK